MEFDPRYGCSQCLAVFRTGHARCPLDGTPLQVLTGDPLEGSTFGDRYVIESCVGEGTMGRVYRARHQSVSRQFAIKVLFGDHATDGTMRARFAREAEMASRLDHPNTIGVVDYGETEQYLCYLVMDWVEGRELRDVLGDEAPLPRGRCVDLMRQICAGLGHAHEAELVHRDLKSENILVTVDRGREVARIVDFGIAVLADMAAGDRLTTEGIVIGTPAYMSPEHVTGGAVDGRTDLFSLGVVLYEMLSGVTPFQGSPMDVARANLSEQPPAIAERVPGLEADPRLEAVAMQLMAKDAADRFQTAEEVIAALNDIDRPATVETNPTQLIGSFDKPRRKRGVIAGVAVAVVAIGLLFVITGDGANGKATGEAMQKVALQDSEVEQTEAQPAETATELLPEAATEPSLDAAVSSPQLESPAVVAPMPRTKRSVSSTPVDPASASPAADTSPTGGAKAPAPGPASESFDARYRRIGGELRHLASVAGDAPARPLRERYLAIPYSDALRHDSIRRDAQRALGALETKIKNLLEAMGHQ